MTAAWKRRRARRRLKAHTKGISDRHNPGMNLLAKRERAMIERRVGRLQPTPDRPQVGRIDRSDYTPAEDRPTLAEQVRHAVDAGLLPNPEDA